jgi:hypothetical protein
MKPHKHAELIHAWADGAEIESSFDGYVWGLIAEPGWHEDVGYRIKPESKPDTVKAVRVFRDFSHMEEPIYHNPANLKLTFDGETGKLKSAEVFV